MLSVYDYRHYYRLASCSVVPVCWDDNYQLLKHPLIKNTTADPSEEYLLQWRIQGDFFNGFHENPLFKSDGYSATFMHYLMTVANILVLLHNQPRALLTTKCKQISLSRMTFNQSCFLDCWCVLRQENIEAMSYKIAFMLLIVQREIDQHVS